MVKAALTVAPVIAMVEETEAEAPDDPVINRIRALVNQALDDMREALLGLETVNESMERLRE
jgi:hypothetical protein